MTARDNRRRKARARRRLRVWHRKMFLPRYDAFMSRVWDDAALLDAMYPPSPWAVTRDEQGWVADFADLVEPGSMEVRRNAEGRIVATGVGTMVSEHSAYSARVKLGPVEP